MNIIYGVSGEGYGHATHALAIAKHLEKKGHKILIITYGRGYDILKDKFKTFLVNGFYLDCKEGKINLKKTLFYNSTHFLKNLKDIRILNKKFKEFKPDICITDMEPLVSWLSLLKKIPLISMSNQNRFTNYILSIPKEYKKEYLLAKLAIKFITPKADYYIALSLSNLNPKKSKKNFIVAPIIKDEVKNLKTSKKNKIVVYLSKENPKFIESLKSIKENFIIFPAEMEKTEKNLKFRKKENFLKELKDCKAIISNSGFTSVGEAIFLKKPYLAIPLESHFEQIFNSIYIKNNCFGEYLPNPKKEDIIKFIKKIDFYSQNLKKSEEKNYSEIFYILDNILENVMTE